MFASTRQTSAPVCSASTRPALAHTSLELSSSMPQNITLLGASVAGDRKTHCTRRNISPLALRIGTGRARSGEATSFFVHHLCFGAFSPAVKLASNESIGSYTFSLTLINIPPRQHLLLHLALSPVTLFKPWAVQQHSYSLRQVRVSEDRPVPAHPDNEQPRPRFGRMARSSRQQKRPRFQGSGTAAMSSWLRTALFAGGRMA